MKKKESYRKILGKLPRNARRAYLLFARARYKSTPMQSVLPEVLLLLDEDPELANEARQQAWTLVRVRDLLKEGALPEAERLVDALGPARGIGALVTMREGRVSEMGRQIGEGLMEIEKERRGRQDPLKNATPARRARAAAKRRTQLRELVELAQKAYLAQVDGVKRGGLPTLMAIQVDVQRDYVDEDGKPRLGLGRIQRILTKKILEREGLSFD